MTVFETTDAPAPRLQFVSHILRRNRLLISLVALHLLCAMAVGQYLGISYWSSTTPALLSIVIKLFSFMFASFLIFRFGVAVFVARPKKPIHWMLNDWKSKLTDMEKAPDALISFLCIVVLVITYSFLKNTIHALNPFLWDVQFVQIDHVIHGGTDPWEILWPILGHPRLTTALNFAYHLWFLLIYIGVCMACLDRRNPTRSTVFLVAFVLCWFVGGNILATVFASVGPVYYEAFGFSDRFAPQLELLRASHEISPVWSLAVQDMLLEGFTEREFAKGISAMPSMHVATSALLALYGFTYARWLGWLMTAFAFVILLGSVHLGWHYAIDGYASIIMVFGLWWVAKKLTARFGPET